MFLFKKKKKKVINSKYQIRDFVYFRRKDELEFGFIYEIKENDENEVVYDIQLCGQCPAVIYDIKETQILRKE